MKELITLEDRKAAAIELLRTKPESMTESQLNLAMALLVYKEIHAPDDGEPPLWVKRGNKLVAFSPMTKGDDYLEVVSNVAIVTGTHEECDDEEEDELVTSRWYSCHAFFGGTSTEGTDLLRVVGITCAKLLAHQVDYAASWGNK